MVGDKRSSRKRVKPPVPVKPTVPEVRKLPTGRLAMIKDPRIWARTLPPVRVPYVRILGLDLSSTTGATFCDIVPRQPISSALIVGGEWNLSVGPHDTNSIRYVRFKQFLHFTNPTLICYEEVKYTGKSPDAGKPMPLQALVARAVSGAMVVHGLSAILTTWAEQNNVPCQSLPIGTIKKYATGKGNANKEEMIRACNARFGTELDPSTYELTGADNIADSMFICAMGVDLYSNGLSSDASTQP